MMSGRGTAADGIIDMAGAANAFADFDGYKIVNDEAIIAAKPDAVLVMQRGEHALSADTVFAQPALAMTPAAEHKTLISMDGAYLLGFGPRTARAARDLAMRLYPDVYGGTLPSEQSSGAVRATDDGADIPPAVAPALSGAVSHRRWPSCWFWSAALVAVAVGLAVGRGRGMSLQRVVAALFRRRRRHDICRPRSDDFAVDPAAARRDGGDCRRAAGRGRRADAGPVP